MNTNDLYKRLKKENITYINYPLIGTRAMIAHYKGLTVIVVDETQITSQSSMNTVLIQELGHYLSGSYYKINSGYEFIYHMEFNADKRAWEEFFPYHEVKRLVEQGLTTVSQLAKYYNVEAPYISRCINYYHKRSHGFSRDKI